MGHIWTFVLLFAVSAPHLTKTISISSNGQSPQKTRGMAFKDVEVGGFVPITPAKNYRQLKTTQVEKNHFNSSMADLPVNERYRRLIPYMTFYLANDFSAPQSDFYTPKTQTESAKFVSQYSNIPRFQGNRLTQYNIASAYPNKIVPNYYTPKQEDEGDYYPVQSILRAPSKNQQVPVYNFQRPIAVPVKVSAVDIYNAGEASVVQPRQKPQKYKLVPYEQSPPVEISKSYAQKLIPVPVSTRPSFYGDYYPAEPQPQPQQQQVVYQSDPRYKYYDEEGYPEIEHVTHNYISTPKTTLEAIPTTGSGFKPILQNARPTKLTYYAPPKEYTPSNLEKPYPQHVYKQPKSQVVQYKPELVQISTPSSRNVNYGPSSGDQFEQNNLAHILKRLQITNSVPKTINTGNIDSSIKTLVEVLSNYKSKPAEVETVTNKPQITPYTPKPVHVVTPKPKQYLKKVKPVKKQRPAYVRPTQYVEKGKSYDYEDDLSDTDKNDIGGTPGRPGIDYPTLAVIPPTSFDCKIQRYKGFFGDPETKCQVWHYCDLNGGQASFLCPNGTIFSQVALTCDWWFNVKCSTTAQLYVLNERLYKYILPFSPKFPEDYSGPLVDKYLSIKFKEMEEEDRKKMEEDEDEDEEDLSAENETENETETPTTAEIETEKVEVIEINTSGTSGSLKPYGDDP